MQNRQQSAGSLDSGYGGLSDSYNEHSLKRQLMSRSISKLEDAISEECSSDGSRSPGLPEECDGNREDSTLPACNSEDMVETVEEGKAR